MKFDQSTEYEELYQQCLINRGQRLEDLFKKNSNRANLFSKAISSGSNFIHFDYSKNFITEDTLVKLINLVKGCGLKWKLNEMFNGECINTTEKRPAWHVQLRNPSPIKEVKDELEKMKQLSNDVRSKVWKGQNGHHIINVVNIGIGGSDLGPAMAVAALADANNELKVHFASNVDLQHLDSILVNCFPESTLFIVVSKTFTTRETMLNAQSAKKWLSNSGITDYSKHFIAVSANEQKVNEFGASVVLKMWDWVGGRYSLWSAAGISIMIAIGPDQFQEMLDGANIVDEHFLKTEFEHNVPVLLALIGIWNRNFLKAPTYAIIPYEQALSRFPAYLQQLDMESNGKSTNVRLGGLVDYETGPIVWGEPGTNGQHAFFQHLHQGTDVIPVDFIVGTRGKDSLNGIDGKEHHRVLYANCLAQSEALMNGSFNKDLLHKHFPGNKPSNTIVYRKLNPWTLGALTALYEHKIFVQGIIWGINSFDQWGVELGKKLANVIEEELVAEVGIVKSHDSSTNNLINLFKA